jgi:hypothetical protein
MPIPTSSPTDDEAPLPRANIDGYIFSLLVDLRKYKRNVSSRSPSRRFSASDAALKPDSGSIAPSDPGYLTDINTTHLVIQKLKYRHRRRRYRNTDLIVIKAYAPDTFPFFPLPITFKGDYISIFGIETLVLKQHQIFRR